METTTIIEEMKRFYDNKIDTIEKSLEKRDITIEKSLEKRINNKLETLLKDLKDEKALEHEKEINTIKKSLKKEKKRVNKLETLLKDLTDEKALEPQFIMIRTRIDNLMMILGELEDSINCKLVKYLSEKERKDEQDEIDRYKEGVSQLHEGDELQLVVNCEEKIAKLEARIQITLSARSHVFNNSVYLFLHKARKEKYINIVNNTEYTVTWFHIMIANLTILFQIGVYVFIILALNHERAFFLSLDHDDSKEYFPTPGWLISCTWFGGMGVLYGNILPDIIGVFVLRIRWKLWAQFLIIWEAILAIGTAFQLLSVRQVTDPTEPFLDLFLGMVGIIFVHTLDESIRLAMDTYGLLQQRSKVGVWIVLVYFFIMLSIQSGVILIADFLEWWD